MLYSLLSPAKKLAKTNPYEGLTSDIRFPTDTASLVSELQQYTTDDLVKLMGISTKLATLNHARYTRLEPFSRTAFEPMPAIFLFQGDVYQHLNAEQFNQADLDFCQKRLGILSGLYGLLAPLDLIQAHRLEMGTKLPNPRGPNLYAFWREQVTQAINEHMHNTQASHLINLASKEYFSVIDKNKVNTPIIDIHFKEMKKGALKTIGIFAKRARGAMAQFIIKTRCTKPNDLKKFNAMAYQFSQTHSDESTFVFVRTDHAA